MIDFNNFILEYESTGGYEGRSLSNAAVPATADYYRLTRGDEVDLRIAWVTWTNNERGVRLAEKVRGPQLVERLLKGGRVGIYEGGKFGISDDLEWMELRVMKVRPGRGQLPTAVNVPYTDMVRASGGVSIWDELAGLGAVAIGPRHNLLRERGGNRASTMITTFPAGNVDVPVLAWVLTKVMPIITGFRG